MASAARTDGDLLDAWRLLGIVAETLTEEQVVGIVINVEAERWRDTLDWLATR